MSLLEDKKQHYHYTTVESFDCSVSSGTSLVSTGHQRRLGAENERVTCRAVRS